MDKKTLSKKLLRPCVQAGFGLLTNGHFSGYFTGKIYTGPLKHVCVPGLNCYSCPGAFGSCPIGSLQAVSSDPGFTFSFYVVSFLLVFGAVLGRFVCGWLCPFGFVQDMIYKIPFVKKLKLKNFPGDKVLRYLKYVILLVFVILLPMVVQNIVGMGSPWFCKYICPSGTLLAGIPLVVLNPELAASIGWLFWLKVGILIFLLLLSIIIYRPFCKYLCPLGAIYGVFNPISAYRLKVDQDKCTSCGLCKKVCKMDVATYKTPNSMECIRCGDCISACPHKAIYTTFTSKKKRLALASNTPISVNKIDLESTTTEITNDSEK